MLSQFWTLSADARKRERKRKRRNRKREKKGRKKKRKERKKEREKEGKTERTRANEESDRERKKRQTRERERERRRERGRDWRGGGKKGKKGRKKGGEPTQAGGGERKLHSKRVDRRWRRPTNPPPHLGRPQKGKGKGKAGAGKVRSQNQNTFRGEAKTGRAPKTRRSSERTQHSKQTIEKKPPRLNTTSLPVISQSSSPKTPAHCRREPYTNRKKRGKKGRIPTEHLTGANPAGKTH